MPLVASSGLHSFKSEAPYQRKEVTMKMVLKTLSVEELRSQNSTARQHNRQQRKKARALFSEHGIVVPIIVDERRQIIHID